MATVAGRLEGRKAVQEAKGKEEDRAVVTVLAHVEVAVAMAQAMRVAEESVAAAEEVAAREAVVRAKAEMGAERAAVEDAPACPPDEWEGQEVAGAMEGEETALAWTVAVARVAAVQVVAAWGEAASAVVA